MDTPDLDIAEKRARRVCEIVRDHDLPGKQPRVLAELHHLTRLLADSDIASGKCAEFMTSANVFFSVGKWRRHGAETVWNRLWQHSHSIATRVSILRCARGQEKASFSEAGEAQASESGGGGG